MHNPKCTLANPANRQTVAGQGNSQCPDNSNCFEGAAILPLFTMGTNPLAPIIVAPDTNQNQANKPKINHEKSVS